MKNTIVKICGWTLLCCSFTASAAIVDFQVVLSSSGDADGYGNATLSIDDQALTASWNFSVYNIELPLTAAHIHVGAAGTNGPLVVNFGDQLSGANLYDVDLASVLLNPSNYYINLHNSTYPSGIGALRGQLGSPVPVPAALPLLLSGLGMFAWTRKRRIK